MLEGCTEPGVGMLRELHFAHPPSPARGVGSCLPHRPTLPPCTSEGQKGATPRLLLIISPCEKKGRRASCWAAASTASG